MALKPREKMLAVITGVLLVVAVGWYVVSFLTGPLSTSRGQRATLREELEDKEGQWTRIEAAYKQGQSAKLAAWQRGALAADPKSAGDYYNWLVGVCDRCGIDGPMVISNQARPRRGLFNVLSFTVTGRGNLEDVTKFLHEFYSADRLHKVKQLTMAPLERSSDLDLFMIVEAVALSEKTRSTIDAFQKLMPPGPQNSPAPAESGLGLDEYQRRIVGRNLFASYRPPPPRQEAPKLEPPRFDPSKYAYLTAIVGVDNEPEAWLIIRTTGKRLKLREGGTFEVGEYRGKVLRINRRDAEVEIDGEKWLFPIGDNLREMVKLSEG